MQNDLEVWSSMKTLISLFESVQKLQYYNNVMTGENSLSTRGCWYVASCVLMVSNVIRQSFPIDLSELKHMRDQLPGSDRLDFSRHRIQPSLLQNCF